MAPMFPMVPIAVEREGSAGGPASVTPDEEGSEGRGADVVEAAETPPALSHGFGGEAIYVYDMIN